MNFMPDNLKRGNDIDPYFLFSEALRSINYKEGVDLSNQIHIMSITTDLKYNFSDVLVMKIISIKSVGYILARKVGSSYFI